MIEVATARQVAKSVYSVLVKRKVPQCHSGPDCDNLRTFLMGIIHQKDQNNLHRAGVHQQRNPYGLHKIQPSTPNLRRLRVIATSPLDVGCQNCSSVKVTRKYLREQYCVESITHLLQCFMNGKLLPFPGWDIAQLFGSIDLEQTVSIVKLMCSAHADFLVKK